MTVYGQIAEETADFRAAHLPGVAFAMEEDVAFNAVRHPEMLLVAPRSVAVVDPDGEIVTIDALHIVAIRNLKAKANGTSRR